MDGEPSRIGGGKFIQLPRNIPLRLEGSCNFALIGSCFRQRDGVRRSTRTNGN
jgi:hypothetical protein